jgi:hypothetical protein
VSFEGIHVKGDWNVGRHRISIFSDFRTSDPPKYGRRGGLSGLGGGWKTTFLWPWMFRVKLFVLVYIYIIYLVGGLEQEFYFSIQLGISSSQLTLTQIFQRGRAQPPTRIY